jgi:DNA-binding response OmpR family regulator/DNA-binding CsgD family transcriptional regulator
MPAPRLLIVDDVPDNVALLHDFLTEQGFTLFVSESGTHALAELGTTQPDLILLDVMMPGLDGFETCRRIKADPKYTDVPIFFMTALGDPVDKVRGLQAGAADYIAKPIFPEEVLARIRVHLELRDRNRELAEQNEKLDAAIQRHLRAERAIRDALDRAIFVADATGRPQFVASAAARLLHRYFPAYESTAALPAEIRTWLTQPAGGTLTITREQRRLELTCAPAGDAGESRLVYLDEKAPPPSPEQLRVLGLTPRETEILFWLAHGKTSPEIGIIVGAAPNTVKKHVEKIMQKLGVETRLAAALKAADILGLAA